MLTQVLIFILAIIFIIYLYLIWNLNTWKKRNIPGPKPSILLGNTPNVLLQSQNVILDVDDIYRKHKSTERFIGFFMLRKPKLMITDPSLIRDIIITNFKHFQKNGALNFVDIKLDPILARNPFVLSGPEWKEKRAEITPALTTSRIKASFPIMLNICEKMTKFLENESKMLPKNGINGKDLASRFTMEVVSNCIYGIDAEAFKTNSSERSELMKMGQSLFEQSVFINALFFIMDSFPFIKYILNRPILPKEVEKYFIGLMEHAIKLRKDSKSDRADFLNYLLQLQEKKNLPIIDIAAHTMTFFFDGFETSSVLIGNCLYFLARNEHVQNQLRNEIQMGLDKCKDDSDKFDLITELPYLDQVINETLRLLPPAGMLEKMCTEPCEITNSKGKPVPIFKDDIMNIPLYSIHRDEAYYTDPEKFMPERFSPENGGVKKYKDMGVFLPFSDGPRVCLGQKFGLTQSKVAIFELIRNWYVTLNEKSLKDLTLEVNTIFPLPKGGIWLNFKKVDYCSS